MRVLQALREHHRPATDTEQRTLARWAGWGAVPAVFDDTREDYAEERAALRALLSTDDWAAARRSTLNAHYTDADLVRPIWQFLQHLGFRGGRVLEPGCGPGHFLGFAPDAELVGVEWEPTTAAIARALYPDASILTASFADVRGGDDAFDLAVGNVPFSRVKLHDPEYNANRLAVHNHFIAKSVRMVRPGGVIALITSRYTLDSLDPTAREIIAEAADLITAVRLPNAAHQRAAGTDVITDLLVLRRRDPDTAPSGPAWMGTTAAPGLDITINEFFVAHPEHVLGELASGRGRFGDTDLVVNNGPTDLGGALSTLLARIAQDTPAMRAAPAERAELDLSIGHPAADRFEGTLAAHPDGTFARWINDRWEPHPVPAKQAPELRRLIELRDTVRALLHAESSDHVDEIEPLRARLNTYYETYLRAHGPASRFTWSTATRPAWHVFTQWTNDATLQRLPAKPSTVLDYLGFLADGGCAESRVRKHLEAITTQHTNKNLPLELPPGRLHAIWAACSPEENRPPHLGELSLIREQRKVPPQGGFRSDPFAALVYALEDYDPTTGTAERADLFTTRVMHPTAPVTTVTDPADAISVCLDRHGELRLDVIAELLNAPDTDTAHALLGELVFTDPATETVVVRNDYLSGNVRHKLRVAQDAAKTDAQYRANVTALKDVIPRDLGPAEIEVQLGSWIGPPYVQDFLRELLEDDLVRVEAPGAGVWRVIGGRRRTPQASDIWGTTHRSAHDLTEAVLTGRPIRVTYTDSDGAVHEDAVATSAARQKADDLKDRFRSWVWEDTQRAADIAELYNTKFNAEIPRSYDDIHLSLPGLAFDSPLRPHQKTAIAAQIFNPAFGLFHEVGAGKTLEMICGAMECKRLGMTRRQVVVVPNHMLDQFHAQWLRAYPQANLIAASIEDLQGPKRQRWVTRAATGNWDAIIMTRGAFHAIPVSPETEEQFFDDVILRDIENAHATAIASNCDESTVKELEELKLSAHERIATRLAGLNRDPGLTWDELGVDKVIVDEAQDFANALRTSALPDLGHTGSNRALDLDIKLHALHREHARPRVVLATATPWRNSLGEIYTVLRRFGQIDQDLDSWARTFAELMTTHEMVPGGGFKEKTRLRQLVNVPELMRTLRLCADIRVADDLSLPTPLVTTEMIEVDAIPELMTYNEELGHRYATLPRRPEKGQDNHLSLLEKGVAAALDVREVGIDPSGAQKVDILADLIIEEWQRTRDRIYRRPDGSEHPTRGGLQLVFCSRSTPKPGWNFYTELRGLLVAAGMPERQIRFIHDAKTEQQKAELFRDCNSGAVSVLVGSAEKMGTGVNVQTRALGLYRVSPYWRPDIPHQERGRVERQGNLNDEVFDRTLVSAPSLDAKRWEIVRQKWDAFRPLMTGRVTGRTITVDSDDGDHYAELMAAATGDRRVIERESLTSEVKRLTRLHEAWKRQQTDLRYRVEVMNSDIPVLTQDIDAIDQAITTRVPTRGDNFRITIDNSTYTDRAKAGPALTRYLRQAIAHLDKHDTRTITVGTLGGHTLHAELAPADREISIQLSFHTLPVAVAIHHHKLPNHHGLITRLENHLAGLEELRDDLTEQRDDLRARGDDALTRLGAPFEQQTQLTETTERLDTLNKALLASHPPPEQHAENADTDADAETETDTSDGTHEPSPHPDTPDSETPDASVPASHDAEAPETERRPTVWTQPPRSYDTADTEHDAAAQDVTPASLDDSDTADTGRERTTDLPQADPAAGEQAAGWWTRRIRITEEPGPAEISGTDRDDPPILRSALTTSGFRWKPAEQLWRFQPRHGNTTTETDAVAAIRHALSTLDDIDAQPTTQSEHPPTPQQQAIIDACLAGHDVAVRALAGTGKTSTLRMIARRMPDKRVTYIAFGRAIADEARTAFGPNVTANTMHAFAMRALRNTTYRAKLNRIDTSDGYPNQIVDALQLDPTIHLGPSDSDTTDSDTADAETVARHALATVKKFRESADSDLALHHLPGAFAEHDGPLSQAILDCATMIWHDKTATDSGVLRFTPDDYLKIWALTKPTMPGDLIFFDEVQDVSAVQAAVVQAQSAQTIVVGDSHQSIFGWRGAIDALATWPADTTLDLTQSWRFGGSVETIGNRFLGLLNSSLYLQGNPALPTQLAEIDRAQPHTILCRTNAGAVSNVFAGLEDDLTVALVGGTAAITDIAKAAKALQHGRSTHHPDLAGFTDWDDVRSFAREHDDANALRTFVRLVDQHTPDGLIAMAAQLVNDNERDPQRAAHLTVSTAHKAKGREWDHVRIADDFPEPTTDPDTGDLTLPGGEELRLAYVTVTRAQHTLKLGGLTWIQRHDLPGLAEPAEQPRNLERTETAAPEPGHTPARQDMVHDHQRSPEQPADAPAESPPAPTTDETQTAETPPPAPDAPAHPPSPLHQEPLIAGVTDEQPIDPTHWRWQLAEYEPVDIGVIYIWQRASLRLALAVDDDDNMLAAVNIWDDDHEADDWSERHIATRDELEHVLDQAGLHGVATPWYQPGTWTVRSAWTATDAHHNADTHNAIPVVRDLDGPWKRADNHDDITVITPAARLRLNDRHAVLRHVHGPDADESTRNHCGILLSGKSRRSVSPLAAAQALASADQDTYARAITAACGRTAVKTPFDVTRARNALQRLADGDPSIPAGALGHLISTRASDTEHTVTGIAQAIEFQPPNRATLILATTDGEPPHRIVVDTDATLSVTPRSDTETPNPVSTTAPSPTRHNNPADHPTAAVPPPPGEPERDSEAPWLTPINDVQRIHTIQTAAGYLTRHELWQGAGWSALTLTTTATADDARANHQATLTSAPDTHATYLAVAERYGDLSGADLFPGHPGEEQPAHPGFIAPFPLRLTPADTTPAILAGRLAERRDTLPTALSGRSTTPMHLALSTAISALNDNTDIIETTAWRLAGHDRFPLHTAQQHLQLVECLREAHPPADTPAHLTALIHTVSAIAIRITEITRDPRLHAQARARVLVAQLDPDSLQQAQRATDRRRGIPTGTYAGTELPRQLVGVIPSAALHLLHHTLLTPATSAWPPRRIATITADMPATEADHTAHLLQAVSERLHHASQLPSSSPALTGELDTTTAAERLATIATALGDTENRHITPLNPPTPRAMPPRSRQPKRETTTESASAQLDLWSLQPTDASGAEPEPSPRTWGGLVEHAETLGFTVVLDRAATDARVDEQLRTITIPWPSSDTQRHHQLERALRNLTPRIDNSAEPHASRTQPALTEPTNEVPAHADSENTSSDTRQPEFTEVPLEQEDLELYEDYWNSAEDTAVTRAASDGSTSTAGDPPRIEHPEPTEETNDEPGPLDAGQQRQTDQPPVPVNHGELDDAIDTHWRALTQRAAELNIGPSSIPQESAHDRITALIALAERIGEAQRANTAAVPSSPAHGLPALPHGRSTRRHRDASLRPCRRFTGVLDPAAEPPPHILNPTRRVTSIQPPAATGTQRDPSAAAVTDGPAPNHTHYTAGRHRANRHRPSFAIAQTFSSRTTARHHIPPSLHRPR